MKRIAIVTSLPACRNPRVVKEADALQGAGYDVTVLGPAFTDALAEEDARLSEKGGWRHLNPVDLRRPGAAWTRLRRRLATEAVQRLRLETPQALGYGLGQTLRAARQLGADLTIGHLETGLWVGQRLARAGLRVGHDFEDWYSEDLTAEARVGRPVQLLHRLEAETLAGCAHTTTTSEALADALARGRGGARPGVVYNAFPWADREGLDGRCTDRPDRARPSLHWVSQTVGAGRGLETLCAALHAVPTPVDVHLRGTCTDAEEARLRGLLPAPHRLFIHPLVSPGELLSRIAEHDIGLALEPAEPPNKEYTVSNKILHYLLAGLAVVATDTAGQSEVASMAPQAVRLCRNEDAAHLAEALNALLGSPEALASAKAAALVAAQERFCWERQVPVLLASVDRALAEPVRASRGLS